MRPGEANPIEPVFVSIADAANITGESEWTVKQRLREGIYKAKKSGRRTLIVFDTIKSYIASLPDAKFAPAPPRKAA
jgi:hypothetical protein